MRIMNVAYTYTSFSISNLITHDSTFLSSDRLRHRRKFRPGGGLGGPPQGLFRRRRPSHESAFADIGWRDACFLSPHQAVVRLCSRESCPCFFGLFQELVGSCMYVRITNSRVEKKPNHDWNLIDSLSRNYRYNADVRDLLVIQRRHEKTAAHLSACSGKSQYWDKKVPSKIMVLLGLHIYISPFQSRFDCSVVVVH